MCFSFLSSCERVSAILLPLPASVPNLVRDTSHLWSASPATFITLSDDTAAEQGLANFFYKGTDSNYLGSVGHMVSVAMTQLCRYSGKAAIDNM